LLRKPNALAAAAANAAKNLSISAPVAFTDRRIDDPRECEVGWADGAACHTDLADNYPVVASRSQDASEHVRNPQDDEHPDDRCGQVDRFELSASGLDLLPLLLRGHIR